MNLSQPTRARLTAEDLYRAVECGNREVVKHAIAQGVDPDEYVDPELGETALQLASWMGDVACVQDLLNGKANVSHETNEGTTALILAARQGKTECVQELLRHRADPLHKDSNGWSALLWASWMGQSDALKCLLPLSREHVNISEGVQGATPLMLAARWESHECVEALLSEGADVYAADKHGSLVHSYSSSSILAFIQERTPMKAPSSSSSNSESGSRTSSPKQVEDPGQQLQYSSASSSDSESDAGDDGRSVRTGSSQRRGEGIHIEDAPQAAVSEDAGEDKGRSAGDADPSPVLDDTEADTTPHVYSPTLSGPVHGDIHSDETHKDPQVMSLSQSVSELAPAARPQAEQTCDYEPIVSHASFDVPKVVLGVAVLTGAGYLIMRPRALKQLYRTFLR